MCSDAYLFELRILAENVTKTSVAKLKTSLILFVKQGSKNLMMDSLIPSLIYKKSLSLGRTPFQI